MKRLITLCLVLPAVFSIAGSQTLVYAGGGVPVYTDRTAWESAAGGYDEEFFIDAILNPSVSVVSNNGSVDTGNGVWWDEVGGLGQATTTWHFAHPITAFGGYWDLAGPGGPGTGIDVYIEGHRVAEIPNTLSGGFWGFTASPSFSNVLLTAAGTGGVEAYELDNMVYSTIIPAPGAILLGSIGVAFVGWLRRRRTL